ncbi:MAG TPA: response regulator transcription factor [Solirubrobacteraceae bacterium]|nr:response regulator transcription factor [Solirubrobacteraceae bacterium]
MRPQPPITLALTRFEDLVGRGLLALTEEDPSVLVVAHDVSIEDLPPTLGEHEPQVAIVNYGSLRTPIEIHELYVAHPGTRLVVLANRPTQAECNQMLAFGATACLSKSTQGRDILNAIHLASRGLHVLPRTPEELTPLDSGPDLLTPREADVLELLQQGRSNAEIAATLHVGIETVRTHARNVFRKLGVRTRRELAGLTSRSSSPISAAR